MTEPTVTFAGFEPGAFAWFAALEKDNSKAWFDEHRDEYRTTVLDPLELMLDELSDEFGGRVRTFRQNRDIRFSADKSPYKTTTYGLIVDRPESVGALYAQLSARGLYAGAGVHDFSSDQLERYRGAVAEEKTGEPLVRIVADLQTEGNEFGGAALKTAPRGYPRDHPRVELLRHKALWTGRPLRTRRGIQRDTALEHARGVWRAAAPLEAWITEQVGPSELPPEERFRRGRRRR